LITVDTYDRRILSIASGKGREHDFSVFKRTFDGAHPDVVILGDSGFQGICDIHSNSWIPNKKPKVGTLSDGEKVENRRLSGYRICVEHVIRAVKRFRILSSRYRNRRKQSPPWA